MKYQSYMYQHGLLETAKAVSWLSVFSYHHQAGEVERLFVSSMLIGVQMSPLAILAIMLIFSALQTPQHRSYHPIFSIWIICAENYLSSLTRLFLTELRFASSTLTVSPNRNLVAFRQELKCIHHYRPCRVPPYTVGSPSPNNFSVVFAYNIIFKINFIACMPFQQCSLLPV